MLKKSISIIVLSLFILFLAAFGYTQPDSSVSLPISKEPITLTCLVYPTDRLLNLCDDDLNNTPFFQELEKRTNIHIDWITSLDELESQSHFNQSDKKTPDLMENAYGNYSYGTSLDIGIDDGAILNLTDLIPEYAPNYYKAIQNPDLASTVHTASGRIGALYTVRKEVQGPWAGLQIRKDWLDELGLSIPVTYDDWETVLTAFKEKKGATAPLFLSASGTMPDNSLNAGFQVAGNFFHIEDTVLYGPAETGWKEYLTLMNRWYEKGLISPNFMTSTGTYPDNTMIESGASGAWYNLYSFSSTVTFQDNPEHGEVVAVAAPKKAASDTVHIRQADSYTDNYFVVSSSCAYPKEALQWIDYLFSEAGSLFANYGIEGETYTLDESGAPVFTDQIKNNPDGLSFSEAVSMFTYPAGFPGFYNDWKREWQSLSAENTAMCDVWTASDTEYMLPSGINLTPEENIRYSAIMSDLYSYVNDYTVRFITGIASLDDDYETYLNELQEKGLPEAKQIIQNAYNRYLLSTGKNTTNTQ